MIPVLITTGTDAAVTCSALLSKDRKYGTVRDPWIGLKAHLCRVEIVRTIVAEN